MHVTCIAYAADMHVHTYIYAYEYVCMDKYVAIPPTPLLCITCCFKKKDKKNNCTLSISSILFPSQICHIIGDSLSSIAQRLLNEKKASAPPCPGSLCQTVFE